APTSISQRTPAVWWRGPFTSRWTERPRACAGKSTWEQVWMQPQLYSTETVDKRGDGYVLSPQQGRAARRELADRTQSAIPNNGGRGIEAVGENRGSGAGGRQRRQPEETPAKHGEEPESRSGGGDHLLHDGRKGRGRALGNRRGS